LTRAANERPHCRSRATSVAQARLVFSKLLDELPGLKMIIHHAGGMVPFFEERIGPGWDQLGSRTSFTDYRKLLTELKRRPLDYFKDFYADTATFGSQAAIEKAGLDAESSTPEELSAVVRKDHARWGSVIKGSNITVE